jgi:hypothetical protein
MKDVYDNTGGANLSAASAKYQKFLICRAKSTGKRLMGNSGQGIAG